MALRLALLAVLVPTLALGAAGALRITSAQPECEAPPPATPSPAPSPTPRPPLGVAPTPTPAPDPRAPVDPLLTNQVSAAAARLAACWNAGDWRAVARSATPRFLETAFGIDAPDEQERARALAALGLGPMTIEKIGPVIIWSDGRGAVDVLYRLGEGPPTQAVAARWFLRAGRGTVHFDEQRLLPPPPLGDRVTNGFAITPDAYPLQWASPASERIPAAPVIALHGANRTAAMHAIILQDERGQTIGLLVLPAQQQVDLVILDLPPGTYRLLAPSLQAELEFQVVGADD